MGSLMSGWDSPVLDSKSAAYKRNRSFTKEEIGAYWKSKQKTIEEHLKQISSPSSDSDVNQQEEVVMETGKQLQRSIRSLPLANTKQGLKEEDDDETSFARLIKKNGWWTRSNSAFLNEPPVPEVASNTYVSQFHVA